MKQKFPIQGISKFYEDEELRKRFFNRGTGPKARYNCNFNLHTSPAANRRDTYHAFMKPTPP